MKGLYARQYIGNLSRPKKEIVEYVLHVLSNGLNIDQCRSFVDSSDEREHELDRGEFHSHLK